MHFPLTMPGSKRRVFPQILPHIPRPLSGGGYVLPCFGTGADAQYLTDDGRSVRLAGDANPHVCRLLHAMKTTPDDLLTAVRHLAEAFPATLDAQRAWYHANRAAFNSALGTDEVASAKHSAVFLCLWRAAFNGLCRCAASGHMNAAPGMSKATGPKKSLLDQAALAGYAAWLQTTCDVQCTDYSTLLDQATTGDVVYVDPPYLGTFDGYFGKRFDTDLLVTNLRALSARNVTWAMSNAMSTRWGADFPTAQMHIVTRSGSVSCKGTGRQPVQEVLIVQEAQ